MRQQKLILKLAVLKGECSLAIPEALVCTNSTHEAIKKLISFTLVNWFGSLKGPKSPLELRHCVWECGKWRLLILVLLNYWISSALHLILCSPPWHSFSFWAVIAYSYWETAAKINHRKASSISLQSTLLSVKGHVSGDLFLDVEHFCKTTSEVTSNLC